MREKKSMFRCALFVDMLEDRIVPVIGTTGAGPHANGTEFNGVVQLWSNPTSPNKSYGSGSLLNTGLHILTAAHVVSEDGPPGGPTLVIPDSTFTFEMQRNGTKLAPLEIKIPGGTDYVNIRPGYVGVGNHDIAVITIPDQSLSTQNPNRTMIAPFGVTRYELYSGSTLNNFTFVGFGETGDGTLGNYTDRYDRITIPNPTAGEYFTCIYNGVSSDPIPQTAPLTDIIVKLGLLLGGDNVSVRQEGLPAGTFDVRFINGLGGGNTAGATFTATRTNPASGAPSWTTLVTGGMLNSDRRSGLNEIESFGSDTLLCDFDGGGKNVFYSSGLGTAEAIPGRGDSGGPALMIGPNNEFQIAGVTSYFQSGGAKNDATYFINYAKEEDADGSFGEIAAFTNVQYHKTLFLNPILAKSYDVILDMTYQAYGRDGIDENIKISVERNNNNLEIWVEGQVPVLLGGNKEELYFSAPVSQVKSLIIFGSTDNETVIINGDLGIPGNISVATYLGIDEIIVNDSMASAVEHHYTFDIPPLFGFQRMHRGVAPSSGAPVVVIGALDIAGTEKFTLIGSPGPDTVRIDYVAPIFTSGFFVNSYHGNDKLFVGNSANGLSKIQLNVSVDGGGGTDSLDIVDTAPTTIAVDYQITDAAGVVAGDMRLLRNDSQSSTYIAIDSKDIEKYSLFTNNLDNKFLIEKVSSSLSQGLFIYANGGSDKVYVGNSSDGLSKINNTVFAHGGNDSGDIIEINDSTNTINDLHYIVRKNEFTEWDMELIRPGAPVLTSSLEKYILRTGSGKDVIRIEQVSQLLIDGLHVFAGNGVDDITLGSASFGLDKLSAVSFIDGEAGKTSIIYLDDKGGAKRNYSYGFSDQANGWDMRLGFYNGPAIAHSKSVNRYTISATKYNDKVQIDATSSSVTEPTFVIGNDGDDWVFVGSAVDGLKFITKDVKVTGGLGKDDLIIDDANNKNGASIDVYEKYVEIASGAWIESVDNINRFIHNGTGDDNVTVYSNSKNTDNDLSIYSNDGGDTVRLTGEFDNNLEDTLGNISIYGGDSGYVDTLILDDSDTIFNDNVTVLNDTVMIDGLDLFVTYNSIEELEIYTGDYEDEIAVYGMFPETRLTVSAGESIDEFVLVDGEVLDPVFIDVEKLKILGGRLTMITPPTPESFEDYDQSGGILDGEATVAASKTLKWTGGEMSGFGSTIGGGENTLNSKEGDTFLYDRILILGPESKTKWEGGFIQGDTGTVQNMGEFEGTGTLDGTFMNVGELMPGELNDEEIGWIYVNGEFYHTNGTIHYDLDGADCDRIVVTEEDLGPPLPQLVYLGGDVTFTAISSLSHIDYILIENDGEHTDGEFQGYPEGTDVYLDGRRYVITYLGLNGGGYHVVLDPTPIGQDDGVYITCKCTPIDLNVLANDLDDDTMYPVVIDPPLFGSVGYNAQTGDLTYYPDNYFIGTVTFTYSPADWLSQDYEAYTVTINVVNCPPHALDDFYVTYEDTPVSGNVLLNDWDNCNDPLTATLVSGPSHGTLEFYPDGSFYYVPDPDWNGEDSFVYMVDDGFGGIAYATAYITVLPVNDEPVVTSPTITTQVDVSIFDTLLNNIFDVDGDILTFVIRTLPDIGDLIVQTNGVYTYDPPLGITGNTTFEVDVDDTKGEIVTRQLYIRVNAPPVVVDDNHEIYQDQLVVSNVLDNDTDPNDDTLIVSVTEEPEHGELTMIGKGLFIYNPDEEWWGTDSFDYEVSDGYGGTDTGTVTIIVDDAKAPPPGVGGSNGNPGETQRSRLTTVTLDFDDPVDASTLDVLGGIILTRTTATPSGFVATIVQSGAMGANGRVILSQTSGMVTSLTLTFDNADSSNVTAGVEYGSLADGRWLLAIPSLGYHTEVGDTNFRRLFGDINNDGTVDSTDFTDFGSAFGSTVGSSNYITAFDFNQDGTIDFLDFAEFGNRYGLTL